MSTISEIAPDPLWPRKYSVVGTAVSATTYSEALDCVMHAARDHRPACVAHMPVHGLMVAANDGEMREALKAFEIVAPDGQPVRHALNLLYGLDLPERCYGPEFMLRLCERAAAEQAPVYLYGSTNDVVRGLAEQLKTLNPGLIVAGCESPALPMPAEGDPGFAARINASGAGIVFIGLGCPLQEKFAFAHRDETRAVLVCVGAAFDFLSGNKRMAPAWMQRHSLEWLFRLTQEPGRLWKRYLIWNPLFVWRLGLQLARRGVRRP